MPTVKVSVDVWGDEMSVFHDTSPRVDGSGKFSDAMLAISFMLSTMGVYGLEDAMVLVRVGDGRSGLRTRNQVRSRRFWMFTLLLCRGWHVQ